MSCKDTPESPYSPLQSFNDPSGYVKVEMIGSPTSYNEVYTGIYHADAGPYFGYGGTRLGSGVAYGILKNTGTKTVTSVRLTINYFGEGEFLGQAVVPSWPIFSEFYSWEAGQPLDTVVYFSDCTLKSDEEVKWLGFLPHEGNDWRRRIVWEETQFIIEWDETS